MQEEVSQVPNLVKVISSSKVSIPTFVPFGSTVSYVPTTSTVELLPTRTTIHEVTPSNVTHVPTNEFALETPQENIVNMFSYLPQVTSIMLDDFDKILVETSFKPNESSIENPPFVVNTTSTSPIVTIVSHNQCISSQTLVYVFENVYALLPLLVSNTPKRKKLAISPDDFDFGQSVPVKPKATKKTKTI